MYHVRNVSKWRTNTFLPHFLIFTLFHLSFPAFSANISVSKLPITLVSSSVSVTFASSLLGSLFASDCTTKTEADHLQHPRQFSCFLERNQFGGFTSVVLLDAASNFSNDARFSSLTEASPSLMNIGNSSRNNENVEMRSLMTETIVKCFDETYSAPFMNFFDLLILVFPIEKLGKRILFPDM